MSAFHSICFILTIVVHLSNYFVRVESIVSCKNCITGAENTETLPLGFQVFSFAKSEISTILGIFTLLIAFISGVWTVIWGTEQTSSICWALFVDCSQGIIFGNLLKLGHFVGSKSRVILKC